jgi:hypothetical protein
MYRMDPTERTLGRYFGSLAADRVASLAHEAEIVRRHTGSRFSSRWLAHERYERRIVQSCPPVEPGLKDKRERPALRSTVKIHMLRHTYTAARLQTLDHGAPISPYTMKRELGHGTSGSSRRYMAIWERSGTARTRWSIGSSNRRNGSTGAWLRSTGRY